MSGWMSRGVKISSLTRDGNADEGDGFEAWLARNPPPIRSSRVPILQTKEPTRVRRLSWQDLPGKVSTRGWRWDDERRLFTRHDGSCEIVPPRAFPPPWRARGIGGLRYGDFLCALEKAECRNRSGRQFIALLASESSAMAVFRGDGNAIRHRVITAYTVRRGQGGAQALRSGRNQARSDGGKLRAREALRLARETATTFYEWNEEISQCELLVQSGDVRVWNAVYNVHEYNGKIVPRNDDRWQAAGISIRRPRFKDLETVFQENGMVEIREFES